MCFLIGILLCESDAGFVQRKPGRGDTTLSMSCFDKITRWSVVGIQGLLAMTIFQINVVAISKFKIFQHFADIHHAM